MAFPSLRPRMSVDRLLFSALAAAILIAAFAGHDAPAVPEATASVPGEAAGPVPVAPLAVVPTEAAATAVHLPAGSSPVTAPAAGATALQQPIAPTKWLPSGKGMWIYEPAKTEGGNVNAIVAKAKATGLTHLWVRMGSAWDGFNVVPFVNQLLPAAHAAGIKVIGWDFPKFEPVEADIQRAIAMIRHTTPGGHQIDAFSPDIETRAEGTRLSPQAAKRYGSLLREAVGQDYTLIATVPRPSKERPNHPYAEIVAGYDAIAPMIYWLDRQPDTDVTGALRDLAKFNKPVYPVGQAYDGLREGGRKGVPPPDELFRFMRFAEKHGAAGVSFWSWQAANQPAWNAIREAVEFRTPEPAPAAATASPALIDVHHLP